MLKCKDAEAQLTAIEHFPEIRWFVKQSAQRANTDLPVCVRTKIESGACHATVFNLDVSGHDYLRQQHSNVTFEFKEGSPSDTVTKLKAQELGNKFKHAGAIELYRHLTSVLSEDDRVLQRFEDSPIRMIPFHCDRDHPVKDAYVCEKGEIGLYELEETSVPAVQEIIEEWSGTYTDESGMVWQAKLGPSHFCYVVTAFYIDTRPRKLWCVGACAAR